ncbi:MAG: calcium-binding protein [Deltaproteobacteria bacterium]|nr:MAG: calcium-binding protein [Deltaproteobacteria bacterium]
MGLRALAHIADASSAAAESTGGVAEVTRGGTAAADPVEGRVGVETDQSFVEGRSHLALRLVVCELLLRLELGSGKAIGELVGGCRRFFGAATFVFRRLFLGLLEDVLREHARSLAHGFRSGLVGLRVRRHDRAAQREQRHGGQREHGADTAAAEDHAHAATAGALGLFALALLPPLLGRRQHRELRAGLGRGVIRALLGGAHGRFHGGGGIDRFDGRRGIDRFHGGGGVDRFDGRRGIDRFHGGGGVDRVFLDHVGGRVIFLDLVLGGVAVRRPQRLGRRPLGRELVVLGVLVVRPHGLGRRVVFLDLVVARVLVVRPHRLRRRVVPVDLVFRGIRIHVRERTRGQTREDVVEADSRRRSEVRTQHVQRFDDLGVEVRWGLGTGVAFQPHRELLCLLFGVHGG